MKNLRRAAAPEAGGGRIRRWRRWIVRTALLAALLGAAATWLAQRHVVSAARPFVHGVGDVPAAECVLVPGARISANGEPSPMLVDRLTAALELYRLGRAPQLLVSGRGGGGIAVDEVLAMRRWLEARGVAPEAIVDDPAGLRTIASLRRCRDVYGFRSAIVVSNPFHVPRCVFLGRQFGLAVVGVPAPALYDYSTATLWKNRGREVLARVRACVDALMAE